MQLHNLVFRMSSVKVRMAFIIEKITTHFWIIPGSITISLIFLLFVLKDLSFEPHDFVRQLIFLKSSPDAVRQLLSSIATSVMTVLGVVFSVIILVIENMSNQYTPRVVGNFTRSTIAQVVLGFYVGTFSYCLILLMNIEGNKAAIPHLAVAFAGILAMSCLLLLIVYIHNITTSIRSTEIIKSISVEAIHSLRNIIKDRACSDRSEHVRTKGYQFSQTLHSQKTGYIDFIDWKKFEKNIGLLDWQIQFHKSAGDFVHKESEILTLWTDEALEQEKVEKLIDFIDVTSNRTIAQDPGYGVQKLCDIALKALSPGINDASTAIEAIHSLTAVILEYVKNFPLQNRVQLDARREIVFVACQEKDITVKPYERILTFAQEHENVKEVIRNEMRYIQGKIENRDLRKFVSRKIDSIEWSAEPLQH